MLIILGQLVYIKTIIQKHIFRLNKHPICKFISFDIKIKKLSTCPDEMNVKFVFSIIHASLSPTTIINPLHSYFIKVMRFYLAFPGRIRQINQYAVIQAVKDFTCSNISSNSSRARGMECQVFRLYLMISCFIRQICSILESANVPETRYFTIPSFRPWIAPR